jgi:hypothetical protein
VDTDPHKPPLKTFTFTVGAKFQCTDLALEPQQVPTAGRWVAGQRMVRTEEEMRRKEILLP